jgi:CHAT domain-containing protein
VERVEAEAYLAIASKDWQTAASGLEDLTYLSPRDPAFRNDLGAVYLELGATEPWFLTAAFEQFMKASELEPRAVEPRFNLVLAYEALYLAEEARATRMVVQGLRGDSRWLSELDEPPSADAMATRPPSSGLDEMWQSFERLGPNLGSDEDPFQRDEALRELAASDDATARAVLAPLSGENADAVVLLRDSLRSVQEDFRAGRFRTGLSKLDESRPLLSLVRSEFDSLLFRLTEVEGRLWVGGSEASVRESLGEIIRRTGELDLKWLQARALTARGSAPHLFGRPASIESLKLARTLYDEIGASTASIRPMIRHAIYLLLEGSVQEGFSMTHSGLASIDPTAESQLRDLYWLMGMIPLSNSSLSIAYVHKAAALSKSGGEVAESQLRLAELYAADKQYERAQSHLQAAEAAAMSIQDANAEAATRLAALLVEAQVAIGSGNLTDGEQALEEGRTLIEDLRRERGGTIPYYEYGYLSELATLYASTRRPAEAAGTFQAAVNAVEREDSELTGGARLAFDERRRAVYESAVGFEIDRGETAVAWAYEQQYRSKLWNESVLSLGKASPAAEPRPEDRSPQGGRIVEYTMLPDRLLIWVAADGDPRVATVDVSREQLQADVHRLVDLIADRGSPDEIDALSGQLYSTLLGPVEDLLVGAEWIALVPDRALHQLPFGALRNGDGQYVAQVYPPLVETPNVDYFRTAAAAPSGQPSLVALGSPDADLAMRRELRSLGRIYPDIETVGGYDVTPAVFLDRMDDAGLFVYTGHSREGTGSLSASVLLNGVIDGQVITAPEISARRLAPGAIVVLSSCDSSVGNNIGGVEFRGLTSAFLAAGAGAVVGSLWPVASPETADLMIDFHARLARGEPVAAALRSAQISMIAEGLPPFYWAGFTVTGNRVALDEAYFTRTAAMAAARPSR